MDEDVTVDDLRRDEVAGLGWSGSATHLRNVAGQLDRRDAGVVDYLVVRDAEGVPIAKAGIVYDELPGCGVIMQMATREDVQGRGHASRLVAEAERRIAARGVRRAVLSVEPANERAARLYAHLGYRPIGERDVGWDYEREDGVLDHYRTRIVDLAKDL